jgi:hypothetical protein
MQYASNQESEVLVKYGLILFRVNCIRCLVTAKHISASRANKVAIIIGIIFSLLPSSAQAPAKFSWAELALILFPPAPLLARPE